jgi:dTDP-4-dehydrorhamnose reductase
MTALPTILVTGANGQLGKEMKQLESAYPGFRFIFLSREDMPVHHFELVRNVFKGYQPQYLVNCAAYTAVDKAESEKELAFQVNGEAVGVMAAVCKEYGTKFIHISTDYVFDGNGTTPYATDAPTNPQSVYGASKLKGEQEAMQYNPESIIIRTSWVYSEFGKNFVKTMRKLMSEREELNVVSDQIGSPTYAADLAQMIMQIIAGGNWVPGMYHFSNSGVISWYDFAVAIRDLSGLQCRIQPIPSSQYPTPAKRPAYSVMDTSSIFSTFHATPRNWKDSLRDCLTKL